MTLREQYRKETGKPEWFYPNVRNQTSGGFEKCLRNTLCYINWLEDYISKLEKPSPPPPDREKAGSDISDDVDNGYAID